MDQILTMASVIFAFFFMIVFPGFFLSLLFFDLGKIKLFERIALSVALSLSIVPLIVFYANISGMPITQINVMILTYGIVLTSWIGIAIKHYL